LVESHGRSRDELLLFEGNLPEADRGSQKNKSGAIPMANQRATAEGTAAYARRFVFYPQNYRSVLNCSISSLGIGTYLGNEDAGTDEAYFAAIRAAVTGGISLIDTAINYRCQRSERVIGQVIDELVRSGELERDQVMIATKGGYIPFDGSIPANPRVWVEENYIKRGIVGPGDLVQGMHCMTPRYLGAMLELSRSNLRLPALDVYYIHNPETQLAEITRSEFSARIRKAFEFLEEAAERGQIGCYGVATWNGFRLKPADRGYLSLTELVKAANEVGGSGHHFKIIQLPYNLAMTEALSLRNQVLADGSEVSVLAAADAMGIAVCTSATLLQGQLTSRLPELLQTVFPGLESDAQRSIQFVRSTPGVSVALVGMSSVAHVVHNLATLRHPPAPDSLMRLFTRA
jgi:aryl-alcohol dehydrogenase-like predicted oxidoreductase